MIVLDCLKRNSCSYFTLFNGLRLLTLVVPFASHDDFFVSEMFLDDKYLKYFGWELNDRCPEVRGVVVATLTELFGDEEKNQRLELFCSKFKVHLQAFFLCLSRVLWYECVYLSVLS